MVPAYAVTATLLLGRRFRLRLVVVYGAATLVVLALFAAIDLSRPVDKRTHLGRLVALPSLDNVQLSTATTATLGKKDVVNFTILANLRGAGGGA